MTASVRDAPKGNEDMGQAYTITARKGAPPPVFGLYEYIVRQIRNSLKH